jgi:UPF0271 protein
MRIDLNADVGEVESTTDLDVDRQLLAVVTSANIACGLHAGNREVMRATVRLARDRGVAVGAHPSFPDRTGFGRRELHMPTHEVERLVAAQVSDLVDVAASVGVALQHVKPHGALYNMAARDQALAEAVARGVQTAAPGAVLLGLAGSALIDAARRLGVPVAAEAFADRAYRADGTLVPRTEPGALLDDPEAAAARMLRVLESGTVIAAGGETVPLKADSICVHGDTPDAVAMARRLRELLVAHGVVVRAFGAP